MINKQMYGDLAALGIRHDDVILMHSSLSSLGYVEGGAETVIDTLTALLDGGTLLIPALSFASVRPENPYFSLLGTPSCVGAISEYFRTRPGVGRSMHPTHSVCGIGEGAERLLSGHYRSETPVGPDSPMALLPKVNGKILMLGCGLRPNTSMHGVEELTVPPYLYRPEPVEYHLTDADGRETVKKYRAHNFAGVIQRYDRLAEIMDIPGGRVLGAEAFLIDAAEMWEKADRKLKENETFFVDRRE